MKHFAFDDDGLVHILLDDDFTRETFVDVWCGERMLEIAGKQTDDAPTCLECIAMEIAPACAPMTLVGVTTGRMSCKEPNMTMKPRTK